VTPADVAALDLPQLFTSAQAAEILRGLGLPEMTECACALAPTDGRFRSTSTAVASG